MLSVTNSSVVPTHSSTSHHLSSTSVHSSVHSSVRSSTSTNHTSSCTQHCTKTSTKAPISSHATHHNQTSTVTVPKSSSASNRHHNSTVTVTSCTECKKTTETFVSTGTNGPITRTVTTVVPTKSGGPSHSQAPAESTTLQTNNGVQKTPTLAGLSVAAIVLLSLAM